MRKNLLRLRKFAALFVACLGLAFLLVYIQWNVYRPLDASSYDRDRPKILVNQVGYLPKQTKVALLANFKGNDAQTVELVEVTTQKVLLAVPAAIGVRDKLSNEVLQAVDFSNFDREGEYILRIGDLKSVPFPIGKQVYEKPLAVLLRSYYLQRCGVAIADPVTGISHPPCHLKDAALAHSDSQHKEGTQLQSLGGWHDAGDYGKYVATATITIGRLLHLYEKHPNLFSDGQLQIPESGNRVPDLLDEMQVGLDWLLTMQRADGAVYRKLSGKNWPIGLAPDKDTQSRFIYGVSTPETAKFSATMAIAARVYLPFQKERAAIYLAAAKFAWQYLETQPVMQIDKVDGDDSGSGGYLYSDIDNEASLLTDTDDRLWAAAELWITTEGTKFQQYFTEHVDGFAYTLFEWKDPSPLALTSILEQEKAFISPDIKDKIKRKILHRAEGLLQKVNSSGYRLANHRLIWGSNKMAAEEGITLAYAYQLTQNPAFRNAAIAQLDYLFGRNPFNQTFVTGIGTNPVRKTNHLFARATAIYIPGLVVGGPNRGAQDGIAPKERGLWSYIDDERSYATNEYAIDYNASLVVLMGEVLSFMPT
ncbi:Endoglucanase [Tumidithrix helvetica PCC 7403]|uniref:glycoside hydrolase family 9 protein n=1 Tax=Tumidithrix helvetica TaxID=3457545 RepID=UPI003C89BFB4